MINSIEIVKIKLSTKENHINLDFYTIIFKSVFKQCRD